jgi:hypothetical protein
MPEDRAPGHPISDDRHAEVCVRTSRASPQVGTPPLSAMALQRGQMPDRLSRRRCTKSLPMAHAGAWRENSPRGADEREAAEVVASRP